MKFTVISAFPEFFKPFFGTSIIGRATAKGLISYELLNPRDFAESPHKQIDDYAYGGGGMVMMAEPLARAVEAAASNASKVILMSPQGRRLDQALVEELATENHLLLLCGHYEGVDERFVESFVDLEVSIGDFVLTGGEIPAMALMDALSRRIPGVVGKTEAVEEDSFFRGMLDTPHYTRPAEWRGKKVPGILLSGDHGEVRAWRRQEAIRRTIERRPDLLENADIRPYLRKGVYVLFNVDLDEEDTADRVLPTLAEDAAAMGCKKAFLVSVRGEKTARYCVNRVKERISEALGTGFLKAAGGVEAASEWVKKRETAEPCVVPAGYFRNGAGTALRRVKREALEKGKPVIFCFQCCRKQSQDSPKEDAEGKEKERDLSLSGSLAVTLDRFFGYSRC